MAEIEEWLNKTHAHSYEALQKTIAEKKIKEEVMKKTNAEAKVHAAHLKDPTQPSPPVYNGIPYNNTDNSFPYLPLVMEYLQSIGLKMSPSVLRYESQHPDVEVSRDSLADITFTRSFDRTPILVQMVDQEYKAVTIEQEAQQ